LIPKRSQARQKRFDDRGYRIPIVLSPKIGPMNRTSGATPSLSAWAGNADSSGPLPAITKLALIP